ncbi:MAG: diguanylate cyclase domain-containing protein [Christensenellales bacterium]|jgi:diguanylate cyclase (GGDEF)-like protein
MTKYILKENKIITDDNVVIIESENTNQLENLLELLNDLQSKLDYDKSGAFSRYKLTEDFKKQKWNFIYVDLNNLKTVNDTMGHVKGDEHIEAVVNLLKGYGNTYRQGGDEFVLLLDDEALVQKFAHENYKNPYFSFGIVLKHEYENAFQAYTLADKRMYENKFENKCLFKPEWYFLNLIK